MTPDQLSEWLANQPGATEGLLDHGQATPPARAGVAPPGPGVSGPDNQPGLNDSQIIAEFRKPNGTTAWLQKDNREVYERKGYVLTGNEFSIEAYNDQVRTLDKWRAVGEQPGANRATWPPAPPPPPPTPPVGEPPSLHGNP